MCRREEDTSYPAPIPSPLLGFGPCPVQPPETQRAAAAPLHVPAPAADAPHPLPAPSRPRKGTCQIVRRAPSPLFPELLDKQQQLQQQARGSPGGIEQRQSPVVSREPQRIPRSPSPRPRGAQGPAPKRPLTRGGSRGGLRCFPVAAATALSRSCPACGSGRGGWVEDATLD